MIKEKLDDLIEDGFRIVQFQMIQGDDIGIYHLVVLAEKFQFQTGYETLFHEYEKPIMEG